MPRRNSRDPETDPAAAFGEALALLREAAGITSQEAAAARLNRSHDTISRWETGAVVPDEDALNRCLDEYRVTGVARATIMVSWRLARKVKGPIAESAARYFANEGKADFVRIWAHVQVPGLLQTEGYAGAMHELPGSDLDVGRERVRVRMQRQSVLKRPDPPEVIAALDEAVLYRQIGTPQVMVDQIDALLKASERPNVTIQVVRGIGTYWGLSGAFLIASGREIPDTLVIVGTKDQVTEDGPLIRQTLVQFEKIRNEGLNVGDSRAALTKARGHWESRQS
jgi:transcriptional regulator with XRE-family HTH domain